MNENYKDRFSGIQRLYGVHNAKKINESSVTVVGLGGVGSWIVESLARSGVGEISLVDFDDICVSNTNRQIQALKSEIGKQKTKVLKERLTNINPEIKVNIFDCPFDLKTQDEILNIKPNCVIDAIDHAYTKLHIAKACMKHNISLVTVGSAGGRNDPTQIKVSDLAHTKEDNLLAILRKDLRQQCGLPRKGDLGIKAVYSLEKPLYPLSDDKFTRIKPEQFKKPLDCSTGFGTITHVTGTFGFMAAHLTLEILMKPSVSIWDTEVKINVQVKIRSKKESVEKTDENHFIVRVNAQPVDGEANKRIIKLLAEYFKTAPSNVELISGSQSKSKRFLVSI